MEKYKCLLATPPLMNEDHHNEDVENMNGQKLDKYRVSEPRMGDRQLSCPHPDGSAPQMVRGSISLKWAHTSPTPNGSEGARVPAKASSSRAALPPFSIASFHVQAAETNDASKVDHHPHIYPATCAEVLAKT